MEFLESATTQTPGSTRAVQVIVTTHSPNLASKIPLKNIVLLQGQRAFSLAADQTKLDAGDYRFLERFLDVTKANLFFARGVLTVEGDAEAILLPTLAKLMGHDLTEHGVSIVNVGGVGLSRYARILQRADPAQGELKIPVSCLSDMDVMPDCAPLIVGKVESDDRTTWSSRRRWRTKGDFGTDDASIQQGLDARKDRLRSGDAQSVKTFVAPQWTLEYDLAFSGLAKEVYRSAVFAANDDPLNEEKKNRADLETQADAEFAAFEVSSGGDNEKLCSIVMEMFTSKRASKAVAAQYLAEDLKTRIASGLIDSTWLQDRIPTYIKDAVAHVTSQSNALPPTVEPSSETAP